MTEPSDMDALLIGIDAGCLPVFERLAEEGRIPTIERLCSDGVTTKLRSQIPPWTPSAWPSMYTGVNPGKHGVTGFVGYDGYDWHVVSHDDVGAHPIWTLLDAHGLRSVMVNVPVTHPPRSFDGAIIPGFIGPEHPECHPPGLLEDVRSAIGEYRVYPTYTRDSERLSDEEKMEEYQALIRMRGAAFRYLTDRETPDFGFVQFQKTDTVFHEFDGDEQKVNTVYETVDSEIERVIESCSPEHIFLASDHGIGQYGRYEFRVNEFLRREGYVETTNCGKGMPSWNPIRMELREGKDVSTWEPTRTERLAAQAAKFGLTAHRVAVVLARVRLLSLVRRIVPSNVARTANVQVDFAESTGYLRTRTELGIRLNVAGREPEGTVDPDAYERVRDEIIAALRQVTTPEGDPMFEQVCPRERYFSGERVEQAVDIVMIPTEMNYFLSEQLGDEMFTEPEASWDHKMDGVFVATGPGIDTGVELAGAHIFDVTPTILAALGLPRSERMDGEVLPIVEDRGTHEYETFDGLRTDSSEFEADVEGRLADLGYL